MGNIFDNGVRVNVKNLYNVLFLIYMDVISEWVMRENVMGLG